MSLRRLLGGGSVDPRSIATLIEVFDRSVVDLDLLTDARREKAAKIIIRLAQGQGRLDAAKLRMSPV